MDPIPVSTLLRGEIAEEFAGCFYREADFDFRPYEAGQEDPGHRDVYLIPSRQVHTLIPLAIGAVEVLTLKDISAVAWVWIHPFERTMSAGRWTQVWRWLQSRYAVLSLEGPLTAPMRKWVQGRDIKVYQRS